MDDDLPTATALVRLRERDSGPWVTLVAPLEAAGGEVKADVLRFRELVARATDQLASRMGAEGDELARALRDLAEERQPFAPARGSLLIVASPRQLHRWHLPERCAPLAAVDERPLVVPLLGALSRAMRFHLLAWSQRDVRLFTCDRLGAAQVTLPPGAPSRLEDAAGWEIEEQHLQFRTAARGRGDPGNWNAFHGQGGGKDDREVDLVKFARAVDEAVRKVLRDAAREPVVLACDPALEGVFRGLTKLPDVVEPALHGNHEREDAAALHAAAWPLVEPRFERRVEDVRQRYFDLRNQGRTADRIEDVVPFAAQGRVEALIVREGGGVEGLVDDDDRVAHGAFDRPTTDLVERAASDTLARDGEVHVLPPERMPGEGDVAAILRW